MKKSKRKLNLERNENENMMIQNLWEIIKAVLREFIGYKLNSRNIRQFSNNLNLHPKELEKIEEMKPQVSRKKEIIKIREEINEIELKKNQWHEKLALWKDRIFSE